MFHAIFDLKHSTINDEKRFLFLYINIPAAATTTAACCCYFFSCRAISLVIFLIVFFFHRNAEANRRHDITRCSKWLVHRIQY